MFCFVLFCFVLFLILYVCFLKLLCDFLSAKLESFNQGSSSDATTEKLEERLVSALTIAMVVDEFNLPLSAKQWTGLLEGLRFPLIPKTASNALVKRISETFNPEYKYVIYVQ